MPEGERFHLALPASLNPKNVVAMK